MRKSLRCPHGLPIAITMEQGVAVYRHIEDGEYCQPMNSFATSPEDILRLMIGSILDNNEFAGFLELGQNLREFEASMADAGQGSKNRFHEFAIMFKRSKNVREMVYQKIASLSAEKKTIPCAQKLFSLVLVVLSGEKLFAKEREFKMLVAEFIVSYGFAFGRAQPRLAICGEAGGQYDRRLRFLEQEIAFQKKYVYNLRTSDKYDISSWDA
ncbi:MAG: hypothetical protein LBO03_06395 [Acidaminococcales bacterium]|jgi:hypothetical protein|nr:hypothetical protein [Acidaminococcales bacterium]